MSKSYVKTADAPAEFQASVEPGDTFDADYDDSDERALVCAGWIALSKQKKKGEE